jgi:hypothetical protein
MFRPRVSISGPEGIWHPKFIRFSDCRCLHGYVVFNRWRQNHEVYYRICLRTRTVNRYVKTNHEMEQRGILASLAFKRLSARKTNEDFVVTLGHCTLGNRSVTRCLREARFPPSIHGASSLDIEDPSMMPIKLSCSMWRTIHLPRCGSSHDSQTSLQQPSNTASPDHSDSPCIIFVERSCSVRHAKGRASRSFPKIATNSRSSAQSSVVWHCHSRPVTLLSENGVRHAVNPVSGVLGIMTNHTSPEIGHRMRVWEKPIHPERSTFRSHINFWAVLLEFSRANYNGESRSH